MLGFVASDQHYLAPLVDVVEVVPGSPLAPVPHGRPPLLGVATHRSSLLAVFALDRPSGGHTTPPWLVVLGTGPDRLGVAADELVGMEHLDDDELLKAHQDEADAVPVTGLRRRDGAAVLDVELLLTSDHFAVVHDTSSPRPSDHP